MQSDWSLFLITRSLEHDYGGSEDWNQSMKHQIRGGGRPRRLPGLAARGGVLSGEGRKSTLGPPLRGCGGSGTRRTEGKQS